MSLLRFRTRYSLIFLSLAAAVASMGSGCAARVHPRIFANTVAEAGWTSGGGELIRHARNPWFLQNTKNVDYCVEIDETNFGLDRAQVETIALKTLEAWKLEFSVTESYKIPPSGVVLKVATQNFRQVPCNDSISLRFQFGVLTEEQLSQLGNPKKFLGLSIRTDYDVVHMRGRGFVYISPTRGPLKFDGLGVASEPWSIENGALLYGVLLHEVGHIFGLAHTTDMSPMNERFSEIIVNEESAQRMAQVLKEFPLFHVFKYPEDPGPWVGNERCGSLQSRNFYGVPNGISCISHSVKNRKFTVEGIRADRSRFEIGSASLKRIDPASAEPALWIYLPDQQAVFLGATAGLVSGPRMQERTVFKGVYKTIDGLSREIGITARPFAAYTVSGAMDGSLFMDVDEGF